MSLCYHTDHEPRCRAEPEAHAAGRLRSHESGHGPPLDGRGRPSARRPGGGAHPGGRRQRDRRRRCRGNDARGGAPGHGELCRRGSHPGACGEVAEDLRGDRRRALSAPGVRRVLPDPVRRRDPHRHSAHRRPRHAGRLVRGARALGHQELRRGCRAGVRVREERLSGLDLQRRDVRAERGEDGALAHLRLTVPARREAPQAPARSSWSASWRGASSS